MKRNGVKSNLSVMTILFFSLPICTMDKALSIKDYFAAYRAVDKRHAEESRNFRRRMISCGTVQDVSQLKIELNKLKQSIGKIRRKTLRNFYQNCNIELPDWNDCIEACNDIIASNKQNMCALLSPLYVSSDVNFPKDARLMIAQRLQQLGVSTSGVQFECSNDDDFLYRVTASTDERSIGCLTISTKTWKESDCEQRDFACMCMIEELFEPLSIVVQLVIFLWPSLIELPESRYKVIELQNRARVLSVFSASIRNQENAILAKQYALSMGNTYFSPRYYAFISAVEWRWKVLEYLKGYFATNLDERIFFVIGGPDWRECDLFSYFYSCAN